MAVPLARVIGSSGNVVQSKKSYALDSYRLSIICLTPLRVVHTMAGTLTFHRLEENSMSKQLSRLMLILICVASTSVAHAQIRSATLTGTVTDPQQGVVPGATVVVTNEGTNATVRLVTNESGL